MRPHAPSEHLHCLQSQAVPQVGADDYYSRFTYRPANREFTPDRVPV